MIALFFHVFVNLVRHGRGRRVLSRGITKHECVIELDLFSQRLRLFEIVVGLARKSDDDVGGNCDSLPRLTNTTDKIDIFLGRVSSMHRFKNFVRA